MTFKQTLFAIVGSTAILGAGVASSINSKPMPKTLEQAIAQNPAVMSQLVPENYNPNTPISYAVYNPDNGNIRFVGNDGRLVTLTDTQVRDLRGTNLSSVQELVPTPAGVPPAPTPYNAPQGLVPYNAPQNPTINGNQNQQIVNYGANAHIIVGGQPIPLRSLQPIPSRRVCVPVYRTPTRTCVPLRTCTPYVDNTGFWGHGPVRRTLGWLFYGPVVHTHTQSGAVVRQRVPWTSIGPRPYSW